MKLQRLGGYAAFAGVLAYAAFVASAARYQPLSDWSDPAKMMAVLSAVPNKYYLTALLWIISNILFLPLMFALRERMQANAPYITGAMLISTSAAIAMAVAESIINLKSVAMIVPQQDLSAFRAAWAVTQGLHWANGHAFAWALLLLGCAALKTRAFSRILAGLLLLTGILWIPNVFFVQLGFTRLTLIYIATSCISAIWCGIELLRQKQSQPAAKEMVALQ